MGKEFLSKIEKILKTTGRICLVLAVIVAIIKVISGTKELLLLTIIIVATLAINLISDYYIKRS